jgi:ABC-2 type transport system permease protein
VRTEMLKLSTVRTPWALLATAQIVIVFGAVGPFLRGGTVDPAAVRSGAAHLGLTALFALVLGIMAVAGEHRHRTVTDTYLGEPRRGRVLGAKLGVHLLAGVVFGAVGTVTALASTAVAVIVTDLSVDWTDAVLWRTVAGGFSWNVMFAVIGVALGALVGNLTAAITGALAWLALVEGVVGMVVGADAARWLPFSAGAALGNLPTGSGGLSQATAGAVLAGYAVLLTVAAVAVTGRRDIT